MGVVWFFGFCKVFRVVLGWFLDFRVGFKGC